MKGAITVIYDTDSKTPIAIGLPKGQKPHPINEMVFLCEGICLLIHEANRQGAKKDSDSIRDCIRHIQLGFSDETFKTSTVKK